VGAEFAASYALDLAPWDAPLQWFVPTGDLVRIYAAAGRTVSAGSIEECQGIFSAMALAIRWLAWTVEPLVLNSSPLLTQRLRNLPVGGLDDMAAWTQRMWQRWSAWLRDGPPAVLPDSDGPQRHRGAEGLAAAAGAGAGRGDRMRFARAFVTLLSSHAATAPLLAPLAAESEPGATGGVWLRYDTGHRDAALLTDALNARGPAQRRRRARRGIALRVARAVSDAVRGAEAGAGALAGFPELLFDFLSAAGFGAALEALPSDAVRTNATATTGTAKRAVLQTLFRRAIEVHAADTPSEKRLRGMAPRITASTVLGSTAPAAGTPFAILTSPVAQDALGTALAAGRFAGPLHPPSLVVSAHGRSLVNASASDPAGAPVGLPQTGAIYILPQNASLSPAGAPVSIPLPAASSIAGADVVAKLGWAACVLDLNADGVDDLAVSAPGLGADWATNDQPWAPVYTYRGAVAVFLGQRGVGLASTPALFFAADEAFTYFGHSLHCTDLNGDGFADLAVGSPFARAPDPISKNYTVAGVQQGRVDVYFASASAWPWGSEGGPAHLDAFASANVTMKGSSQYELFGMALSSYGPVPMSAGVVQTSDRLALQSDCTESAGTTNVTFLLVGSPGYRLPQTNVSIGRMSVFAFSDDASSSSCGAVATSIPIRTYTGDLSLNLPQPYLNGSLLISSRFGASFSVGFPLGVDGGPYLAIGIPCTDRGDSTSIRYLTSAGAVAVLPFDLSSNETDIPWPRILALSRVRFLSGMPEARFGSAVLFHDANHDGFDDLVVAASMFSPGFVLLPRTTEDSQLSVGASPQHENGRIMMFMGANANAYPSGSVIKAETTANWTADGMAPAGRLGHSFTFFDYTGDGSDELLVSAPYTDANSAETSGAVYLFAMQ
jgi:hypothetical protein